MADPTNEAGDEPKSGVLVETGSFKVDRSRALEKLMRFTLGERMFLLPWVRCAVGSGAGAISMRNVPGAHSCIEMEFDGRPLTREQLRDPYACLFNSRDEENIRNRNLAVGLLTVLQLHPSIVNVSSGIGPERVQLTVRSLDNESVQASREPSAKTRIQVVFSDARIPDESALAAECLVWVSRFCTACPIPITINDKPIVRLPQAEPTPGLEFKGEVSGWLTAPRDPGPSSLLKACSYGVMASSIEIELPDIQVFGYVNDNGFVLNASQSSVVRNARFTKTMNEAAAQARKLMLLVIEEHAKSFPGLVPGIRDDPKLGFYWKDRLERGSEAEEARLADLAAKVFGSWILSPLSDGAKREEEIARIRWTARVVAWLRAAAAKLLKDPEKDNGDPLRRALWDAPVLIRQDGKVLTLRELWVQRQKVGYIPVSTKPLPIQALPFQTVWLSSSKDLDVLAALFPAQVRDVTAALDVPAQGRLLYSPKMMAAPKEAANVPIISQPAAVARILRIGARSMKVFRPGDIETEPAPEVPKAKTGDGQDGASEARELVSQVRKILKKLIGTRGMKLPKEAIDSVCLLPMSGDAPLLVGDDGIWKLDQKHKMVARIVQSTLPLETKAVYLSSVLFTAANRMNRYLTDGDDVKFQEALAVMLTSAKT